MHKAQDRTEWRKVVHKKNIEYENTQQPTQSTSSSSHGKGKGSGKSKAPSTNSANEEPPFPNAIICPVIGCGTWCRGRRGLSKHTDRMHTEGTQAQEGFQCPHCPFKTAARCTISMHIRQCHAPGCSPLTCDICHIMVSSKGALSRHRSVEHRDQTDKRFANKRYPQ